MATASLPIDPAMIQRNLECPVCHEAYRRPRILPCGHTLCQVPCLEQIINDKPRFSCPECRTEHAVPESGPSGFPVNVAISRLFEEPTKALQSLPGCPICGEDQVLLKCHHCNLDICEECKIEHTPRFRKQLSDALEAFQEEILLKKSAYESLGTSMKEEVKVAADLVCAEIKKASEELIKAIRLKVKQLNQKVNKFTLDEYDNINHQTEEAFGQLNKVSEFCEAELKELNSDKRLSHVRLTKIQNDFREKSSVLSKRRRVMSVRRKMDVHCKPVKSAIEDFCDVLFAEDKFCEREINVVDEVLTQTSSLLEQTFTTPKLSVGSGGGGPKNLSEPSGVAVDPDTKDIFITDTNNHRVQVFDRSGRHKLSFGSHGKGNEQFSSPAGILISKQGQVIVGDQCNNRVKVHNRDGSFIRAFGKYGSQPGMFNFTYGVAQDSEENIHVCDIDNKRIQIFTETGQFKGEYSSWKLKTVERPWNISITASGRIGVQLDSNIVILNDKQQLLWTFKSNTSLSGICFVDMNHLFLPDYDNHKIRLYTSMGDLIRESGVPGICMGQLQKPCEMAIDGSDVYVVCEESGMVQKF